MLSFLQLPPQRGSKGKDTHNPVNFLPTLPSKRSKPSWQQNPPSFLLSGKPDAKADSNNTIDLVGELTASKSLHQLYAVTPA